MVQMLFLALVVWAYGFPHAFPLLMEISLAFGEGEGGWLLDGPQL